MVRTIAGGPSERSVPWQRLRPLPWERPLSRAEETAEHDSWVKVNAWSRVCRNNFLISTPVRPTTESFLRESQTSVVTTGNPGLYWSHDTTIWKRLPHRHLQVLGSPSPGPPTKAGRQCRSQKEASSRGFRSPISALPTLLRPATVMKVLGVTVLVLLCAGALCSYGKGEFTAHLPLTTAAPHTGAGGQTTSSQSSGLRTPRGNQRASDRVSK